ncbi:MAG: deoxyribodipyrimidine photo-lyase, partial [Flavobacteriales bacterium]|nr:deoxyribodipyrimidine photo-lyase [Flavobacteriales bacterium]
MKRALVWFRNDLRLSDNPALAAAVRHAEEVLPLFVLDPRQTGACSFGLERLGPWRRVFLREGLADL